MTQRIIITYSQGTRYFLITDTITATVDLETTDDDGNVTTQDITADANLSLFSLDPAIADIKYNTITFVFDITLKENGTAVFSAHYNDLVHLKDEAVVYTTFFKDNYQDYLLNEFDKYTVQRNPVLEAILDTIMTFYDIYFSYKEDVKTMKDPQRVKSKYLNNLGQTYGFPRIDYEAENTSLERVFNDTYRELLSNILELTKIRGTKLSFDLFFSALGYDIDIREYWWDDSGNLIDVSSTDDTGSTFYAYNTDGSQVDEPLVAHDDPRLNLSTSNAYNVDNKSNYIRVILSKKDSGLSVTDPAAFSGKQKAIIKKYLEYLRPIHLQYLEEILSMSINDNTDDLELLDITGWDDTGLVSSSILFLLMDGTSGEEDAIKGKYERKATFYKRGNWEADTNIVTDSSTQGYQECGLNGRIRTMETGLADTTQYYFKINIDAGGVTEYDITTSGDTTYDGVIGLMNTAVTGASFNIINGDLRCISDSFGANSTIALSAGTTGTDLFVTLTNFVTFNSAIDGTEYPGASLILVNPPPIGTMGDYYVVTVAGTLFSKTWVIGDWITSNEIEWLQMSTTEVTVAEFSEQKADTGLAEVYIAGTDYTIGEGLGVWEANNYIVPSVLGTADMSSGFDWGTTNQTLIIDYGDTGTNTIVTLDTLTTDAATTVTEINNEFTTAGIDADMEAYASGNYVGIRATSSGKNVNFRIVKGSPDALETLGIDIESSEGYLLNSPVYSGGGVIERLPSAFIDDLNEDIAIPYTLMNDIIKDVLRYDTGWTYDASPVIKYDKSDFFDETLSVASA